MSDTRLFLVPPLLSPLRAVGKMLAAEGVKAYLVGGVVRDILLGRVTADIDIAVSGDALEVAHKVATGSGGKYVLLDKVNRVGRVIKAGGDDSWQIDFTALRGTIEQDLAERDFTIDAMAVDLDALTADAAHTQLIDPFAGASDLKHQVIRGVAETTFESDAGRLLRAVRLAAELGFSIDKRTEALIRRSAHLVAGVAGERIREELLRLLAVTQSRRFLLYLDELGLLTALIPELQGMKGIEQPPEHFWDVFQHLVETVAAVDFLLRQETGGYTNNELLTAVPWSERLAQHFAAEVSHGSTRRVTLKIAALLHDIAKPQTRVIDAHGRMRFLGHPQAGTEIAAGILERLRFSAREIKLVALMVRHHLRPNQMSPTGLPSARAIYRYFRDTADASIDTLFLSLADHLATRGPSLTLAGWQEHAQMVEYVLTQRLQQESRVKPTKLVDGHDLINIFGINPGPQIRELLEAVQEAQAAGELTTREEALAYTRNLLLPK